MPKNRVTVSARANRSMSRWFNILLLNSGHILLKVVRSLFSRFFEWATGALTRLAITTKGHRRGIIKNILLFAVNIYLTTLQISSAKICLPNAYVVQSYVSF